MRDRFSLPEGVVYLTMRGYSWDGPWKMVRTFDMEAVATTGFTYTEGGETDADAPLDNGAFFAKVVQGFTSLLAEHTDDAKVLAGGQSLLPVMALPFWET